MERKTKIVATIADSRCEVDFIKTLYEAGMNVVRINTAHAGFEGATNIVNNVRTVSEKIAILIDTKGPEIRTTETADKKGFCVSANDTILIKETAGNELSSKDCLYIAEKIIDEVPVNASLLIDDGEIEIRIIEKKPDALVGRVMNSGLIKSRKSVNIPNVSISLPSLSEKDRHFIQWAIEMDIDFIAHSFVRRKEDVIAVQEILDQNNSHIKIISKIENQEGVDNFDEILEHTYGVMVARGDLGVEIPAEKVPVIQRSLVSKCIEYKKPVIIATQMLQSMIENPRPTRAEISDVAGAIYQRVDAIMLSGETAYGKYAAEAVKTMHVVAGQIEKDTETIVDLNLVRINNEITAQLSRSAVRACMNLPVEAVVIDTMSGRTARYLSAFRGSKPVYAVCYKKHVMRELALSYGIQPQYQEPSFSHSSFLYNILTSLEKKALLKKEDMIVVVGGNFGAAKGASFMEIGTVLNLQYKYLG